MARAWCAGRNQRKRHMKTQTRRLRTQFEPETRFDVPAPALPFRAVLETELDRLRAALLRQALEENRGATAAVALR